MYSKASRSNELAAQLSVSEEQIKVLKEHKVFLQKELDIARRELKKFRKELDNLSGQMNDMTDDMLESRNKVNTYAKKLGMLFTERHFCNLILLSQQIF